MDNQANDPRPADIEKQIMTAVGYADWQTVAELSTAYARLLKAREAMFHTFQRHMNRFAE